MRDRLPLWVAVAAAFTGAAMLAAWFGKYWPATPWTVVPAAELAAKGRQFAKQFGVNVNDWIPYEVPTVAKLATHYGKGVSGLSLRITFVPRQGGQAAEVGFNSAGFPTYWRAPNGYAPKYESGSSKSAADAAFRTIAGAEAEDYTGPVRSMGEDIREDNYVWEKPRAPHSDFRDEIKVVTKDSAVETVERKVYIAGDEEDYWAVLGGTFGLLCTVGYIAILSIYLLWLARRAISHKFPTRVAVAALLLMSTAVVAGIGWQRRHSLSQHEGVSIFQLLFASASIFCFVAVGRGISGSARPKWVSLEELCLLAPISKPAGTSIAAGILFSPLLAAVPFLVAGCGLFPRAWVLPHDVELLYSPAPLMDSLHIQTLIYLIAFFGFLVPALGRMIRFRWLRWLFVLPIGTIFFADETRVITGPLAAPIVAGLLTLALFWYVWAHFDVLSVVVLQLASGFVMSLLMLDQKGGSIWSLMLTLGCLLVVAYWFHRRGQSVAEGDPLATIPELAGFRAEREKLQAEFSLARRAQQDMLPPTPTIDGYSIAASCTPSLEVGGDLYDFLKLPDGRIAFGVADVSGKGVPAALYMTLTKGLLASVTKDSAQIVPVVEEVNRHLHNVTRKKVFVTMALGFLDPEKRQLQYVRAGHNPIVWRQAVRDTTTLVAPGGLGLGITAGRVFNNQLKVAEMTLAEGDAVVFYSDGITEAMNKDLELFGEHRLMKAIERTDRMEAAEARDSILNDVKAFLGGIHPQDDMTLLVLRVGLAEKVAPNGTEVKG